MYSTCVNDHFNQCQLKHALEVIMMSATAQPDAKTNKQNPKRLCNMNFC